MKVGITLPQIGEHATKENIINLSKKAEKQCFDSLWVLERLVLPLKPSNSESVIRIKTEIVASVRAADAIVVHTLLLLLLQ